MSTPELELDPPVVARTRPRSLRPLVLRLHFYAGILIAPFTLIAAATGGLYAVAPQVEKVLYSDVLSVDPGDQAVSLNQQADAAKAAYPNLAMAAMRPAATSSESTRIFFADPSLGEDERLAVFVNPYTADVLGSKVEWAGALPLSAWLDKFHANLQLGDIGSIYSELAASWLWIVALGGLYLWLVKARKDRRRGRKGRVVGVDRSGSGRARTLNWHGATGVWILLALVFLSATGLTWSTYAGANVTDLRASMGWQRPQLDTSLTGSSVTGGEHAEHEAGDHASMSMPATVDVTCVVSAAHAVGLEAPLELTFPTAPGEAVGVKEDAKAYRLSSDSAAVDPSTLAVTSAVDYDRDYSLAAKLADWGIRGHMGTLFGFLNQLLLLAVAIGLITVIVRGYRMWWQRRPTRGSAMAVGRAPMRGGIRQVSPVLAVALVAVTALVGWFLPVLGWSLLAFLVLDVGVYAWPRARSCSR